MNIAVRIVLPLFALGALTACGGGGGGGGSTPPPAQVTVSGTVTYDRVPHGADGSLDYVATRSEPVRGATVEIIRAAGGTVLASGATDGTGGYRLTVPEHTQVVVRVRARMRRTGAPAWDFQVVDNTSGGAGYAMESPALDSGGGTVRDLHAASGWDGSAYTGTRAAAPFAILDTVYDSVQRVLGADPDIVFPSLRINWSPANRSSADFAPSDGRIRTTAYFFPPIGEIYVLGDADVDTDEFDAHVIAHEWGHYLEQMFARRDSPGGEQSPVRTLDPRLAFAEGWSNAWAAIALDDPLYADSMGVDQADGFTFDVESNAVTTPGWYDPSSVQAILYDLYDAAADGLDSLALGFGPLWQVLTGAHATGEALTTVFSFIAPLKAAQPAVAANIDAVVAEQDIRAVDMDIWGATETNDAGRPDVLPVYTAVTVGGPAARLCTTAAFGAFNGLSVRRFARVDIPAGGRYRFRAAGAAGTDPDLVVYRRGELAPGQARGGDAETLDLDLQAGTHVVEVYAFGNLDSPATGDVCFDLTVSAL